MTHTQLITRPAIVLALLVGATHGASAEVARPISFRFDVLPALSKHGCSAGACHGSPSGKGGFRLSLRGFDPELDRLTLLRETTGRRVDWLAPEKSLLLLKPTMQVAHGGGLKLGKQDLAYSILREWIATGCPDDPTDAPSCVRIEMEPQVAERTWPDAQQQVTVRAFFSDGTSRDITPLTNFTSSDDQVAEVNHAGLVIAQAPGETRIMARYLDFIETTDLQFLNPTEGFEWETPRGNNFIDRLVFTRLKAFQIQPSPPCNDNEFVRRVHLDVLGILPTRVETESFLANTDEFKRDKLIDRLLLREEYADFWAQKWSDLLRVKSSKLSASGLHKFHRWIVHSMRENKPYDQLARELLTARGSTFVNPPAGFYRAMADPNDCAESVSQLFLGIRIQCAKCHNHPFDRWSQDNYYGIGAFFSRVQRKPLSGGEAFVWLDRTSEVTQPRTGQEVKPWLPLAGDVALGTEQDRRELFADWLTSADNPFFARVAVNRIWAHLMGRGIIDPVDDFRADNPAAHPELLESLAQTFVSSGYNQRELIRTILKSQVYQLSSKATASNEQDVKYFSHAYARPLSAEQLFDAICQTTGVPERFASLPQGTRATSLPSPEFGNEFLSVFGQPSRNTVCECERSDDSKLAQTLQLINGPLIPRKLRDSGGRLARAIDNLPARLASAGLPTTEGLVGWFKADDGVITHGEAVERWENQCDVVNSVSQVDPDFRPSYAANSIGGLPTIRFDGINDLLHNTGDRLLPAGSARSIFVVGRLADDTGGALFTFGRERQNGSSVFTAQHIRIGGSYYVYSDGVNGAGNTTAPFEQLELLHQPFMTSFFSSGSGDKLQVRVNGVKLPTVQAGGVGTDQGSPGFTIGSREDVPPGDQCWNGDISEILVYDHCLSEVELVAVETYLATRFDLTTPHPRPPLADRPAVDNREIIIDFYFAALCRQPSDEEIAVAISHLQSAHDRRRGLEDIAWALINSKEFVFQH